VPFDSPAKKQGQSSRNSKRSSAHAKRELRVTVEDYILDHRSQNHSPKTIEWHTLALGNFADFLQKQGITFVEDIERVHVLCWLNHLSSEPGSKGKKLSERLVNCYARSMRAFFLQLVGSAGLCTGRHFQSCENAQSGQVAYPHH